MDKDVILKTEVEVASKDWVRSELRDMEGRIEKAFHDQMLYMSEKHDALTQKYDALRQDMGSQTRWIVGLILTMTIAILVAVLFK